MMIEIELPLQQILILNEMAKYEPMIEYDKYDVKKNASAMAYCLIEAGEQRFKHFDKPNQSGHTLDQMIGFLHAPIVVKQDS